MLIIQSALGFDQDQLALLQRAVAKVNEVIASEDFEDAFHHEAAMNQLAYDYDFDETDDDTDTILKKLRNFELRVNFFLFMPNFWKRHFSSEVAYEDSQGVHFDENKFVEESLADLCDTVAHEGAHEAGYTHFYGAREGNSRSVPVLVGKIVWDIVSRQAA